MRSSFHFCFATGGQTTQLAQQNRNMGDIETAVDLAINPRPKCSQGIRVLGVIFLSDHKALNAMLAQPSRVRVPYLSKETGSSATPEAMPTETDRCFRLAKSGKMP